jgi:hypothetical protein
METATERGLLCWVQVAKIGNRQIDRLISYYVAGVVVWVDNFKGGGCL